MPNFIIRPAHCIDISVANEGIPCAYASGIYFECTTRVPPGQGSQIGHASGGGPEKSKKVGRRLSFDIRATHNLSDIVDASCSTDRAARHCSQVFHAGAFAPKKGMLPRCEACTGITIRSRGVGATHDLSGGVEPKTAALVISLQHTDLSDRISLCKRGESSSENQPCTECNFARPSDHCFLLAIGYSLCGRNRQNLQD